MCDNSDILLEIENLSVEFASKDGIVAAVDDISFAIPRGQTVALLGESGCGKTTTVMSLMGLVPSPPGRIRNGRALLRVESGQEEVDLLSIPEKQMRSFRGSVLTAVFQETTLSLNPVFTVGAQLKRAVGLHHKLKAAAAEKLAVELLSRVGFKSPRQRLRDYPAQMSGGMLNRVALAMALACRPQLLIADEPTAALDVTLQAQLLDLLRELQAETGMSILLVSHDLGVVAQLADWVNVMYAGQIVECGATKSVYERQYHPYTQALFRCTPSVDSSCGALPVIPGNPPDPTAYPPGCRLHPRCVLTEQLARDSKRAATVVNRDGSKVSVLSTCCAGQAAPGESPPLERVAHRHRAACWEIPHE